jgi:hypothetical protein
MKKLILLVISLLTTNVYASCAQDGVQVTFTAFCSTKWAGYCVNYESKFTMITDQPTALLIPRYRAADSIIWVVNKHEGTLTVPGTHIRVILPSGKVLECIS